MAIISKVKNKEQLIAQKNRKIYLDKALKIGFVLQTLVIIYLLFYR
jgi:hypothetical protein